MRPGATVRSAPSARRASTSRPPSRARERALMGEGLLVAGMDEVGRGALAGPVSVGIAVVGPVTGRTPAGLRDSKVIAPAERERLVPSVRRWALAHAVGHAGPEEIDAVGIIAALRLAGRRALSEVQRQGIAPDVVLLDGNHDWLSGPEPDLLSLLPDAPTLGQADLEVPVPRVVLEVKADLRCTVVAAASVLAKVERDALMRTWHDLDPRYDWAANKGYASPSHLAALEQWGAGERHRRSWRLPGAGMMVR